MASCIHKSFERYGKETNEFLGQLIDLASEQTGCSKCMCGTTSYGLVMFTLSAYFALHCTGYIASNQALPPA